MFCNTFGGRGRMLPNFNPIMAKYGCRSRRKLFKFAPEYNEYRKAHRRIPKNSRDDYRKLNLTLLPKIYKRFIMYLKKVSLTVAALALLNLWSCSDDNWDAVDNADPDFTVQSEHVMTAAGRTFKLAGKIKDADGISSITLRCPQLSLNKTIDILSIYGEPLKEYDLDYQFKVQENVEGESFDVAVLITDVVGNVTEKKVLVTLDGDFTAPVFSAAPDKEMTVLMKASPVFNLKFTVEDNHAIDYITVDVEGIDGFPIRIEGEGRNKIEYSNALALPAQLASYNVKIEAFDLPAQENEVRSSKVESTVTVSELPDFSVLYLCDVATAAELNSDVFGVPIAMDHVAPYKYRVRYYNRTAGTKICFLPQKTDFGPICFGPEGDDPKVLGDDPETVGRLQLNTAGVYYLFDVDTFNRTVSFETYPVSQAINPVMHLRYGQNDLWTWNDNWNASDPWMQEWYFGPASGPDNVTRMEQDANNPNIFYINNWQLPEGKTNFILHNWHSNGWWNYTTWRVDDSDDPSKCVYYGCLMPDNIKFTGNADYFNWKYVNADQTEFKFQYPNAGTFDFTNWGNENYRKNFIPDNWVKAEVKAEGKYRLVFDAHTERIMLLPQ